MKMNPVVHFEMPAKDRKRVANFYTNVFGWQTRLMGEEFGNYVLATTTESDEKGPKKPGAINGGFYPKSGPNAYPYPSVVISVDDLKAQMVRVKKAGGKIVGKPMDIPGIGSYVAFVDTEGNRVGMLQPRQMS